MILVDTSIWADHVGRSDTRLQDLLLEGRVIMHPFVIGEVMLGNVRDRAAVLDMLSKMPVLLPVRHSEVMELIDIAPLFGTGVGYVDAHLLASARTTRNCEIWTRDKRLLDVAERLGVAADFG